MKKMIFLGILLSFQLVLACTTPLIRNQYGVPVNLYGDGYLDIINGTKYPSDIKMLKYSMTVQNLNNRKLVLSLTPFSGLTNYVYGGSYDIEPLQTKIITLSVYIDGPTKYGQIYVTGTCIGEFSIPEGFMNIKIYGRGNGSPQYCNNNDLSCGVYPDCQDLTQLGGCYNGYFRSYFCAANSAQYSSTCTSACCRQYAGDDGYCSESVCMNPDNSCNDECSFTGDSCIDGSLYTCQVQQDGCKDLLLKQYCTIGCYENHCVDQSQVTGKIAFLCADSTCQYNKESEIISWLRSTGWYVEEKQYNQWSLAHILQFDVIACSDELLGCKPSANSVVFKAHKNFNKNFIEIADSRYAQAAFKFNYVNNYYSVLATSDSLYDTNKDIIMEVFPKTVKILQNSEKMTVTPDYRLSSDVSDVADVGGDNGKTTLFKVKSSGNHGRYAYIGWFYKAHISSLTPDGIKLLNRTLMWVYCGDGCLTDPNRNLPPVAISKITPNPVAYVNQLIEMDGSQSYDPEKKPLTYYWDFGDGTNSGWITNSKTTHVYNTQGIYNVSLTVKDQELYSEPVVKSIKIKPIIQNKIAFICASNSCNDDTEQGLIIYLRNNGFTVTGKPEEGWTKADLDNYDLMVCSDALSGCNIHSWSAIYDKHMNGDMGFLEIPDYTYLRAARRFGYVSSWSGYKTTSDKIKISASDDITKDFTSLITVFQSQGDMSGVSFGSLQSMVKDLADFTNKDYSLMFKVDASNNRGRYAYVGWLNRIPLSSLTSEGNTILLRTVRWVECGNVDGCS